MGNLNRVMVMGNLAKDPLVCGGDNKVTFITIAVNRGWTSKDGEKKEEVTYIDCKAFDKKGETIAKNFFKGKPILVEGRLVETPINEEYLAEGKKIKCLKVHIDNFEFIGKKSDFMSNGNTEPVDMSEQDSSDFDSLLNETEDVVVGSQS